MNPIFMGYEHYMMSPIDFLKRPLRWLQAINYIRARSTGGPNFAFELLVRKVTRAELDAMHLDLSCIRTLFCGSEPIRPSTMARTMEVSAER